MRITFKDPITGRDRDGLLSVYNSVPSFNENGYPYGRFVNAALFERDGGRWVVRARGSHPLFAGSSNAELAEHGIAASYGDVVFSTGNHIDEKGILHIQATDGDAMVIDATAPVKDVLKYLLRHDADGNRLHHDVDAQS